MCGPAGLVLQGFGALAGANAASAAAKSSKLQLEGNAAIADINAKVSETSAQQALLAGQRNEQNSRLKTAALKGTQRASMAANGVDLGVGSANQILTTTDLMGEIDAQTIRQNAVRDAWGYRVNATNATTSAMMTRGAASAISPDAAFTSSLIANATPVASGWYQYAKNKA